MGQAGVRVTVDMKSGSRQGADGSNRTRYAVVSPKQPRAEGIYWGYDTRLAGGLGAVFTEVTLTLPFRIPIKARCGAVSCFRGNLHLESPRYFLIEGN